MSPTSTHTILNAASESAKKRILPLLLLLTLLATPAAHARALPGPTDADATPVTLAADGQAAMPVVVSPDASETSRTAAEELADYLGRITGAPFELREGDPAAGLAVGAFDEFPDLDLADRFAPDDPFRREQYLLRTHSAGVHLIGATPTAARLAVWDLLYRLGHRQFFPGEKWEVVPDRSNPTVALDLFDSPDYLNRRIWSGGQRWDFAEAPFDDWRIRNRNEAGGGFNLNTGHAYNGIIRRNQEAFDEHPEYLALVDGERGGGRGDKFCIANDDLRELVVQDAVDRVEADTDSISMDPSDGGDWCECDECVAMGSVSDRVVILANDVAEAINNLGLGDKYVGIYAYNQHSPPPSVEVHPNVVVSVATSFIRGGYTARELVEQWADKGAIIGLREYYALSIWTSDLPGRARAANLPYLTRTIPYFHERGARFNSANISDSWGPYGLGFYLLAQLLWDVEKADHLDAFIDDFHERAFGPAREPMEKFYALIYRHDDNDSAPLLSEHLIGLMYRHLDEAHELAGDDQTIQQRLNDLVLYTRYLDLYRQTDAADGSRRQELGEDLLRHIYAIRHTLMVESRRLDHRRLPSFDIPEGDALDEVRSRDAYTTTEIRDMLADGIENNDLLDFEPVGFSNELAPAAEPLDLPQVSTGSLGSHAPRHTRSFYTWLEEPGEINLRVQGGMISHYRDRGNVRLTLHSPLDVLGEGVDFDDSVPPDGQEHTATLESPHTGLHRIEVSDGGDATFVFLEDESLPYTIPAKQGEPFTYRGRWTLYFYVPKGTETIGGYAASTSGRVLDPEGDEVFNFNDLESAGHFSFPVPEDSDGRLWKMENCQGPRYLMTVPPYLARSEKDLLLPREIIERDAP